MGQYTLQVSGMVCNSCEKVVRDAVTKIQGVASVDPDSGNGVVVVEGDEDVRDRVKEAINDAGYVVES